jgi:hypothetical protein
VRSGRSLRSAHGVAPPRPLLCRVKYLWKARDTVAACRRGRHDVDNPGALPSARADHPCRPDEIETAAARRRPSSRNRPPSGRNRDRGSPPPAVVAEPPARRTKPRPRQPAAGRRRGTARPADEIETAPARRRSSSRNRPPSGRNRSQLRPAGRYHPAGGSLALARRADHRRCRTTGTIRRPLREVADLDARVARLEERLINP